MLARKKPDSLIEAAQLVAEQHRQACKQKEELAESDEVAATTRSTPRVRDSEYSAHTHTHAAVQTGLVSDRVVPVTVQTTSGVWQEGGGCCG